MTVLQVIPAVTITRRQPTILVPLGFVTLVSMVKDIIEDYKRYSSDTKENNRKVLVIPQGNQVRDAQTRDGEEVFQDIKWSNVKVGQICKIKCDEYFPADMVLLNSDDPQGICYVETKNLDGETNMKHKVSNKKIMSRITSEAQFKNFIADISCQPPNEFLYKFEGNINFNSTEEDFNNTGRSTNQDSAPLDANQILLRGSSLRNTEYVYGVVVYTGHESKIMKNSPESRYKTSKMEQLTNRFIIYTFILQVAICLFASIYSIVWTHAYREETEQYLQWSLDVGVVSTNPFVGFLVTFASWILIFSDFVPISLLVTLEIVKFIQAQFINWDHTIYNEDKDMPTKAQSSNLNEELGQVEYIFSDKTGTLTQNIMEFKKLVVGPISYGKSVKDIKNLEVNTDDEESKRSQSDPSSEITNVNFYDPKFFEDMKNAEETQKDMIERYLLHLALCHTVIIEKDKSGDKKLSYSASSPDELALVNAARFFGYFFKDRDSENNIVLEFNDGREEKYQLLNVIEFDSTRKRMSVIIRMPNGEIKVLCKGADSIIEERLRDRKNMNQTNSHLESFAREDLRTLLLAEKTIPDQEYQTWNTKYEEACISTENREEKISKISEEIEWDFELIGATAIEDKLQDEVADTINILKEAGIKIWVLTGDKIETAINIGYS